MINKNSLLGMPENKPLFLAACIKKYTEHKFWLAKAQGQKAITAGKYL